MPDDAEFHLWHNPAAGGDIPYNACCQAHEPGKAIKTAADANVIVVATHAPLHGPRSDIQSFDRHPRKTRIMTH